MRGRETEPAGGADVDHDGGMMRPFAPHDALDDDGGGVRDERPGPGRKPIGAAPR